MVTTFAAIRRAVAMVGGNWDKNIAASGVFATEQENSFDEAPAVLTYSLHVAAAAIATVTTLPGGTRKYFLAARAFADRAPAAVIARFGGVSEGPSHESGSASLLGRGIHFTISAVSISPRTAAVRSAQRRSWSFSPIFLARRFCSAVFIAMTSLKMRCLPKPELGK